MLNLNINAYESSLQVIWINYLVFSSWQIRQIGK